MTVVVAYKITEDGEDGEGGCILFFYDKC